MDINFNSFQRLFCWALFVFVFVNSNHLEAQDKTSFRNKYWVYFKDKKTSDKISLPLSKESLERRRIQFIPLDYTDLPVSKNYVDLLKQKNIQIVHTSRWLNAVSAYLSDAEIISLHSCPYIKKMERINSYQITRAKEGANNNESKTKNTFQNTLLHPAPTAELNYGTNKEPIELLNLHKLHTLGYRGKDIRVAVFDDGFRNVDSIEAFAKIFAEKKILGSKDFANPNGSVFEVGGHGTQVSSVMAAWLPGQMIGGSPDASYYFLRTEVVSSETIQEEDNWVAAAEWADSAGAKIFQTSLIYTLFDGNIKSHTYQDLDGDTAPMTIAADLAAQKGILVVNSAGNEGAGSWKYIAVPADGDSVLAVGAIQKDRTISSFSSLGPTSDGRIKPDVVAVGTASPVVGTGGEVTVSNGTSFSAPMISAFAATLWSTTPNATAWNLRQAIIRSADRYEKPDNYYGYGLPDAVKAHGYLVTYTATEEQQKEANNFSVIPNPASDFISIIGNSPDTAIRLKLDIINMEGKRISHFKFKKKEPVFSHVLWLNEIDSNLSNGTYYFRLYTSNAKKILWEGKILIQK